MRKGGHGPRFPEGTEGGGGNGSADDPGVLLPEPEAGGRRRERRRGWGGGTKEGLAGAPYKKRKHKESIMGRKREWGKTLFVKL